MSQFQVLNDMQQALHSNPHVSAHCHLRTIPSKACNSTLVFFGRLRDWRSCPLQLLKSALSWWLLTTCSNCQHFNPSSVSAGQTWGNFERRFAVPLAHFVVTAALRELRG
jgi:hypothetical protein